MIYIEILSFMGTIKVWAKQNQIHCVKRNDLNKPVQHWQDVADLQDSENSTGITAWSPLITGCSQLSWESIPIQKLH